MKTNPELVRGAGMFLNFVTVLNEELIKAGGQPEMLYFTQREHARPLMALLAKTIVESRLWRIPASVILTEIQKQHPDPEFFEHDCKWLWYTFSPMAESLTTCKFADRPEAYSGDVTKGVPNEILAQLPPIDEDGPTVVRFLRQEYVVTYREEDNSAVFLAPARYFDLEN